MMDQPAGPSMFCETMQNPDAKFRSEFLIPHRLFRIALRANRNFDPHCQFCLFWLPIEGMDALSESACLNRLPEPKCNSVGPAWVALNPCQRCHCWHSRKNACNRAELYLPYMTPASPIASNYPLNEQWAPLALYMAREHPVEGNYWTNTNMRTKRNTMNTNSRKCQTVYARPLLEPAALGNWF